MYNSTYVRINNTQLGCHSVMRVLTDCALVIKAYKVNRKYQQKAYITTRMRNDEQILEALTMKRMPLVEKWIYYYLSLNSVSATTNNNFFNLFSLLLVII